MKHNPFFLLFLGLFFITFQKVHAQAPIPNGDFEQWANGKPVGWTVDDTTVSGQSFTPITQTSDAHGGSSALEETVVGVTFGGQTFAQIPPIAISGTVSKNDTGGFRYTDHPNSINGFYKFSPVGGDSASIIAVFKKNGTGIGGGGGTISTAAQNYTSFAFPIYWSSSDAPDSCIITIAVPAYTGTSNAGTTFEVDDLAFSNQSVGGNAVGAQEGAAFALDQNYPNPLLNSSTASITYSLDRPGFAALTIYDMTGRTVATPVHEVESAGAHLLQFDCSNLVTGTYTYRLEANGESLTRVMQILR